MAQVLIVDDDENICAAFVQFLRELGHTPEVASTAREAIEKVRADPPDLVIMDVRMPGLGGLEALPRLREIDPDLHVIMMTAYGTSQTSIDAMRLGAFDYLTKPLDLDVVKPLIEKALESRDLSRRADREERGELPEAGAVPLVGHSAPMQELYKRIGRLSDRDVPVLLVGERGTGRRLVAQTLHETGPRPDRALVTLRCSGRPDAIVEAELFGPTGALAEAAGGSLVLIDIESLGGPLQERLVSALTGGRGGSDRERPRLLATGPPDLAERVAAGQFNDELWDWLRVITLELPPLRERREDIPDLVAHFIRDCNQEFGTAIRGVDEDVARALARHDWPGNVRELQSCIQRACLLARGDFVTLDDVGDELGGRAAAPRAVAADGDPLADASVAAFDALADVESEESPFHEVIARVEAALIREALARTSGNQVRAAELLGVNRTTLRKKILSYGL